MCLFGCEFVGDSPARRFCSVAEGGLERPFVDFDDGAVGVVGEGGADFVEVVEVTDEGVGVGCVEDR